MTDTTTHLLSDEELDDLECGIRSEWPQWSVSYLRLIATLRAERARLAMADELVTKAHAALLMAVHSQTLPVAMFREMYQVPSPFSPESAALRLCRDALVALDTDGADHE